MGFVAARDSIASFSRNIVMALEEARKRNLLTVALLNRAKGWTTSRNFVTGRLLELRGTPAF
jgi:hypothetical protein